VREAIEQRQWTEVDPAVHAVARAIEGYAAEVDKAAELLGQAVRQDR
jgi:hypothetical protein